MNFKTTAILIGLLLVLGAFVYFTRDQSPNYQDVQEAREAALQGQRLMDESFVAADVKQITIEQDGYKAVLHKTADGQWEQSSPVVFPLSQASVQAVLDTLADTRYSEKLEDVSVSNLQGYDLLEGATIVSIASAKDSAKPAHTIHLGRTTLGSRMYAKLEDQAVYVVPDTLARQLQDKPWERWRVRSLVAPMARQVSHVTLSHHAAQANAAGDQVTLSLIRDDGRWRFEQPDTGRADAQQVAAILSNLATTTVEQFAADAPADLSPYGLDQPRLTLQVRSSETAAPTNAASAATPSAINEVDHILKVGRQASLDGASYYATWTRQGQPPAVFTISKAAMDKFALQPDALRDSKLVPVIPSQIRQLSLEHGPRRIAFSRSASGWEFDDQAIAFASDDGVVSQLVNELTRVSATRFMPASAVSGNDPLAVVTMTQLAKAQPRILRVWQANEKDEKGSLQWIARLDDEPVARVFTAAPLEAITQDTWYFRSRDIASIDTDRIDHVTITRQGRTFDFTRQLPGAAGANSQIDEPTAWQRVTSEAANETQGESTANAHGHSEIMRILDHAAVLRAAGWLSPEQTELGPQDQLVTLTLKSGDEKKLQITMNPQGHAKLADGDQLFMVSPQMRDAIMGKTQAGPQTQTPGLQSAE